MDCEESKSPGVRESGSPGVRESWESRSPRVQELSLIFTDVHSFFSIDFHGSEARVSKGVKTTLGELRAQVVPH